MAMVSPALALLFSLSQDPRMPLGPPTASAQAPRSTYSQDVARLAEEYWGLVEQISARERLLRSGKALSTLDRDELTDALTRAEDELHHLQDRLKRGGFWEQVKALQPSARIHDPTPVTSRRTPLSHLGRPSLSYGGLVVEPRRPAYQNSSPYRRTESPEIRHTKPGEYTLDSAVLQYAPHLVHTAGQYAQGEHEHLRDTIHGPGLRRTFTKVMWLGLSVGAQAAINSVAGMVIKGHVPCELLPEQRERESRELDDGGEFPEELAMKAWT